MSAHSSETENVFYHGERTLRTLKENLKNGIPVHKSVWERIMEM